MTGPGPPKPASGGLAADLMRTWETILAGYSKALGQPVPFEFREILMWRVLFAPEGESISAPVQADDVRPGTALYIDISLRLDDMSVKTPSTVWVNEAG